MSSKRKPGIDYIMLIEYDMYTYSRRCYALLSSNGKRGHPDQYGDAVVWRSDRDKVQGVNVYHVLSQFNDKLRKEKETAVGDLVYYVLSKNGYFIACSSRGPNGPPERHGDKVVWRRGGPNATWDECQAEARRLRDCSDSAKGSPSKHRRSAEAEHRRIFRGCLEIYTSVERDKKRRAKSGAGGSL